MRLLKLRAYYEPEVTAGTHFIKDMDEANIANGIVSINYTPMPTRGVDDATRRQYKNKKHEVLYDGAVIVNRFSMFREHKNPIQRAFRYLCCSVCEYSLGIREKDIDLVHSASTPPIQGMLSALTAKRLSKKYGRHVPFVFNLQDIFPDSLVNASMTHKGSLLWKIGRKIEDYTYRSADRIIVISEGFKKNIMEKGVPEEKIVIVPNWVNTESVHPVAREDNILFDRYGLDKSKFYICYSGNIGHSQNIGLLVDVASRLEKELPEARFVLLGEGAAKEELEKSVSEKGLKNMILLPYQPYEEISHVFSLGDAGLIISKPGIGGSSVPSKTWSIMAAERPVLASFDEGELTELISGEGCGICCPAGDAGALIEAVKKMFRMSREGDALSQMGKNGKKYLLEFLDKDKCIAKYIDVLKECAENADKSE